MPIPTPKKIGLLGLEIRQGQGLRKVNVGVRNHIVVRSSCWGWEPPTQIEK